MRDSDEILLKGVKEVGIINTEKPSDREDFKKIAIMNLEIDGKEGKCMDNLHMRCLKRLIKIYLGSGWCKVTSQYKLKQLFAPHKNKH